MKKKYTFQVPCNFFLKTLDWNIFKPQINILFFLIFVLLGTIKSYGQSPFIDNTPNGTETFVVPAGVTSITASVWGAGGGGGGSSLNGEGGSGGGGGGATTLTIAVTPGDVFTYTVGAGGPGGLANATLAGNGGNSTFINIGLGINLLGNGGTGGARNRGAAGTGGTATGGIINSSGQNGTIGDASGQVGGNSGVVIGIFGGGGAAVTNATGSNGTVPGGGGGGAERTGGGSRNGGNGANGEVHITFTCPLISANAGADQNLGTCITTTTLTGSAIPAGMTGTWSIVTGPGTIASPNSATTAISNLVPGTSTTFRWTISNGSCGSVFDNIVVNTLSGPACSPYCLNTYTTAVHPITNVTFSNIINNTSNVVNGTPDHEIFFMPVGQTERGEIYQLSMSGNTNGATEHSVIAFFDWNKDGDFIDAGESFGMGLIDNVTFNTSIYVQVPLTASLGQTRMRIAMHNNNMAYPTACQVGARTGQSEDYIININPETCTSPTAGFSFTAVTGTTATISWTAATPAPANGYDLYISPINTAPNPLPPLETIPTVNDLASPYNATGLTPGVRYYVWIRGNCGSGDYGVWNSMGNFITTLTNDTCAGAIVVPVNAGTNCDVAVEGTLENSVTPNATICGSNNNVDVWYRFTATAVTHRITVVPQPFIDYVASTITDANLRFQVLSGTCGTPVSVACVNNNANSTESQSIGGLVIGTSYFIRVHSSGANRTKFTVCVTTGNATHSSNSAAPASYTIHPTAGFSNRFIQDYNTTGTLTNTVNMNTGRSITGYKNYTGLTAAVGVAGGGINVDLGLRESRQLIKAWVDWNSDGLFDDATETVYNSSGILSIATSFGFVIPGPTAVGNYRFRVRSTNFNRTYTPAIVTNLLPYGFTVDGETEDYTISVIQDCVHQIATVTDNSRCAAGTVTLNVTTNGVPPATHVRWYDAEVGGTLLATTNVVANASSWTTPIISATTEYWVTAFNTVGGCESLYRKKIIATINPVANMFITPSTPEVCGENNIISITAAGDYVVDYLIDENFNTNLGALTSVIIGGAGDALTRWQRQVSPYVPAGGVWKPAIISRSAGDGFAMATSDYNLDVNTALESIILDSSPYSDLTLTFRHYYSYYGVPYDVGYVEVSTDGGTTYIPLQTIVADDGQASNFVSETINMNAYINQTNLKVRFRYNAKFCDGWAVDDVRLYGTKPLSTSFTWGGAPIDVFIDPACTIPYVAQLVPTVYVRPTPLQLASTSWSFTATATLNNGCAVSIPITIENKTKLWKGTVNTDWNDANNWEPAGVPDANTCVIIYDGPNDSRIIGSFYNAFAKYVIVRPNGDLLVNSNNTLTITDNLNVEVGGTATFQNGSSLLQTSNMPNIGNIIYRRTTNIRRLDYVYWSSPVAGFSNSAVSPGTPLGFQLKWLPTTGGINNFGNWTNANETMVLGKGYAIRGDNSLPNSTFTNYTASFVGVPNNGNITIPISRGTWNGGPYSTGVSSTLGLNEDDNWNLVGNPFPSAIDAIDFLTLNTNIEGFVNIWTHGTLPSNAISDPFYANYVFNYTATDYITYNSLGASSGPGTFNGYINAGQGFFVSMRHGSAATTENLIFNNSLRSNGYNNNQFYKTTGNSKSPQTKSIEKHRIWFDLIPPTGSSVRALLGYSENATNDVDRLFDAFSNEKLSLNIFSITNNEKMLIQGRKLPFDPKDEVNIGVTIPQDGLYKIALSAVDGLFLEANQNIYLEDKLIKVIYNLKEAPYSFIGNKGTISDRFVIRFEKDNETLNTNELPNLIQVYDNKVLTVASGKMKIKKIEIFDLLGKQLFYKDNIDDKNIEINSLIRTNSLIVVKIVLENNTEEIRKVLY
ncbi:GEVED domain-containing protein [Flavobacterium difficile]|uniref:Fibronectin type III domain-containing protein n=1 Tax=Flavobacterium difficile TaxID=2709659 RepID=A0ABX0I4W9_9FLAO|nr:GEVED domain-containing protein [Flavobacterium difficile]NHM00839.1 fibronectin type III domain-containing protein [Flavobacterium difficile]